MFIQYLKEIDLHTARNFLKAIFAKCIVNNFVVSICLGKLAVVQVTFAESMLIVSIFSIAK